MTPVSQSPKIYGRIYDFLIQSLWLFYKDAGMMLAWKPDRTAGGHFRLS